MKLSSLWPVLVVVPSITLAVFAQPAGQWYEPTLVYKSAGLKEEKTPEAACKASAADLTAHGQKNEFVRVKPGSTAFTITCMLRDLDQKPPKVWPQENNVEKIPMCLDGTKAVSWDNSGTFASQKCKCDPVAGCPEDRSAPAERAAFTCPKQNASHPVCKAKKKQRPEPRCTQQRAHAVNHNAVAMQSKFNQASLTKDRSSSAATAKYNAALDKIRKDEEDKKAIRTGKDHTGKEFPKFTKADMCDTGGPTDVNIGSLCGTREEDFAAANNMVGLGKTPTSTEAPNLDCVWHHHEELGRMQLVRRSAHNEQHTGGVKVWQEAFGVDYPLCCP
jgi:hypothetical protein